MAHNTSGSMFFRQKRPKYRGFPLKQTQYVSTNTYQLSSTVVEAGGDDLGLFCSNRTWTPCSHQVSCLTKYFRVKRENIWLAVKAWTKLGMVQLDKDLEHSSGSTTEWLKKVLSSQSPDFN